MGWFGDGGGGDGDGCGGGGGDGWIYLMMLITCFDFSRRCAVGKEGERLHTIIHRHTNTLRRVRGRARDCPWIVSVQKKTKIRLHRVEGNTSYNSSSLEIVAAVVL